MGSDATGSRPRSARAGAVHGAADAGGGGEGALRRGAARGAAARVAAAALLLAGLALAGLAAPRAAAAQDEVDVPYVPTPMPVVRQMLALAGPTPEDSLYDLGSGDGRIVITAAEEYGTPGVGVEIDSGRVATARREAEKAGVDDLVRFIRGDLFEVDVSPASVVTLYLLSSVNLELRPKLFRELRPGARVVSHDFDMGDWQPDSVVNMPEHNSTVYFWEMPAQVAGTWKLRLPSGGEVTLEVQQKFQEIRASAPEDGVRIGEARVRGEQIHLTVTGLEGARSAAVELSGTVSGDRMSGTAPGGGRWSAVRTGGGEQPIDQWSGGSGGR